MEGAAEQPVRRAGQGEEWPWDLSRRQDLKDAALTSRLGTGQAVPFSPVAFG